MEQQQEAAATPIDEVKQAPAAVDVKPAESDLLTLRANICTRVLTDKVSMSWGESRPIVIALSANTDDMLQASNSLRDGVNDLISRLVFESDRVKKLVIEQKAARFMDGQTGAKPLTPHDRLTFALASFAHTQVHMGDQFDMKVEDCGDDGSFNIRLALSHAYPQQAMLKLNWLTFMMNQSECYHRIALQMGYMLGTAHATQRLAEAAAAPVPKLEPAAQ